MPPDTDATPMTSATFDTVPDTVPAGIAGMVRAHVGLVALTVVGVAGALTMKLVLALARAGLLADEWLAHMSPNTIEAAMTAAGATACTALMGVLLLDGWSRRFRRARRPGLQPLVSMAVVLLGVALVAKLIAVGTGSLLVYSAAQVADLAAVMTFVVAIGSNARPVHAADSAAAPWFVLAIIGLALMRAVAVGHPDASIAGYLWVVMAAYPAAFGAAWFVWTADGPRPTMVGRNLNLLGIAVVGLVLPWLIVRMVPWRSAMALVAEFHMVAITYSIVAFGLALRAARGMFNVSSAERAVGAAVTFGLLLIAKAGFPNPIAPWIDPGADAFQRFEFQQDQAVVGVFLVGAAATLALLRRRNAARPGDSLLLAAFTATLVSLLAVRIVGEYRAEYLLVVERQLFAQDGTPILYAELGMAVAWAGALLLWIPLALRLARLYPLDGRDDPAEVADTQSAAASDAA